MGLLIFVLLLVAVAVFFAVRAHREGRWNWRGVHRRATTILGVLVLAQGGAVLAYSQAPEKWQDALPDALPGFLPVGMMVLGALSAVANSIKQKADTGNRS